MHNPISGTLSRNLASTSATTPSDSASTRDNLPKNSESIWTVVLDDGSNVTIRPICVDDAERERQFIENLSPESRFHRFLCGMAHPSPTLIKALTDIDHDRDEAYVALIEQNGKQIQIGVSRYCTDSDGKSCECAIAVADEWKHKGLGTLLMHRLIRTAKARHIERMYSIDTADNTDMHDFAQKMGFRREANAADHTQVIHTLMLSKKN